jgi:predicted ATPase
VIDSYERADEASRALLKSLALNAGGCPISIIVASRDGTGEEPQGELVIRLSPLSERETSELLQHLLSGRTFPVALRQELLKRASGVPLYLTQFLKGEKHVLKKYG